MSNKMTPKSENNLKIDYNIETVNIINNKETKIDNEEAESRNISRISKVYDSLSEDEEKLDDFEYETSFFKSKLITLKSNTSLYWFYLIIRGIMISLYFIFYLYFLSFYENPVNFLISIKAKINYLDSYQLFYCILSFSLDFFFAMIFILNLFKEYETEDGIKFLFKFKTLKKNVLSPQILFHSIYSFPFFSLSLFCIYNSNLFVGFEHTLDSLNNYDYSDSVYNSKKGDFIRIFVKNIEVELHNSRFGMIIFLSLFRITTLFKLNNMLNIVKEAYDLSIGTSLIIYSPIYMLYVHAASCVWINIGRNLNSNATWINKYNIKDESNFYIYIHSLYFNVTTVFTVGYGDITPNSFFEYAYINIILLISCSIYSTMISAISSKFTESESKYSTIQKKKDIMEDISIDSPIPEELKNKIMNYFNNSVLTNKEEKSFLIESLPISIKNELLLGMYWEKLKDLKFFFDCNKDIKGFMLNFLKPLNIEKNEILFQKGSIINEIIFVVNGEIHFLLNFQKKFYKFFWINENQSFGEINIYENENIDYEVRSWKYANTELIILQKDDFDNIKSHYPLVIKSKMKEALELYLEMKLKKKLINKVITKKLNEIIMSKNNNDSLKENLKKKITLKSTNFENNLESDEDLSIQSEFNDFNKEKVENKTLKFIKKKTLKLMDQTNNEFDICNTEEKLINKKKSQKIFGKQLDVKEDNINNKKSKRVYFSNKSIKNINKENLKNKQLNNIIKLQNLFTEAKDFLNNNTSIINSKEKEVLKKNQENLNKISHKLIFQKLKKRKKMVEFKTPKIKSKKQIKSKNKNLIVITKSKNIYLKNLLDLIIKQKKDYKNENDNITNTFKKKSKNLTIKLDKTYFEDSNSLSLNIMQEQSNFNFNCRSNEYDTIFARPRKIKSTNKKIKKIISNIPPYKLNKEHNLPKTLKNVVFENREIEKLRKEYLDITNIQEIKIFSQRNIIQPRKISSQKNNSQKKSSPVKNPNTTKNSAKNIGIEGNHEIFNNKQKVLKNSPLINNTLVFQNKKKKKEEFRIKLNRIKSMDINKNKKNQSVEKETKSSLTTKKIIKINKDEETYNNGSKRTSNFQNKNYLDFETKESNNIGKICTENKDKSNFLKQRRLSIDNFLQDFHFNKNVNNFNLNVNINNYQNENQKNVNSNNNSYFVSDNDTSIVKLRTRKKSSDMLDNLLKKNQNEQIFMQNTQLLSQLFQNKLESELEFNNFKNKTGKK